MTSCIPLCAYVGRDSPVAFALVPTPVSPEDDCATELSAIVVGVGEGYEIVGSTSKGICCQWLFALFEDVPHLRFVPVTCSDSARMDVPSIYSIPVA
jgi:hypothetical protein